MGHSHHHDHSHHEHQDSRVLVLSLAVISGFMLLEFVSGYLFKSLSLMADAGHMANDALSLGLALLALKWANNKPHFSRGLTVFNGLSLFIVAIFIIKEAIERLQQPLEMQPLPMIAVAFGGLLVNLWVTKLMNGADQENLNIKAAYLHVLADLLGSVVAIISGLCAYFGGLLWVDPLASLLLSLIILRSAWSLTIAAFKNLKAHQH